MAIPTSLSSQREFQIIYIDIDPLKVAEAIPHSLCVVGLKYNQGQQRLVSRTQHTPSTVVLSKEGLELLKNIPPGKHGFL